MTRMVLKKNEVPPANTLWRTVVFLSIFFKGIFYAYLVTIVFALIAFLVVDTPLNEVVGYALTITPGIGISDGETMRYNAADILKFFVFWGVAFEVIEAFVRIIFRKHIFIKQSYIFWSVTVLHLLALFKFATIENISSALSFTTVSYLLFSVFFLFYSLLGSTGKLLPFRQK